MKMQQECKLVSRAVGMTLLGWTIYRQSILISTEPNQTKPPLPQTSTDILKDAAQAPGVASN